MKSSIFAVCVGEIVLFF